MVGTKGNFLIFASALLIFSVDSSGFEPYEKCAHPVCAIGTVHEGDTKPYIPLSPTVEGGRSTNLAIKSKVGSVSLTFVSSLETNKFSFEYKVLKNTIEATNHAGITFKYEHPFQISGTFSWLSIELIANQVVVKDFHEPSRKFVKLPWGFVKKPIGFTVHGQYAQYVAHCQKTIVTEFITRSGAETCIDFNLPEKLGLVSRLVNDTTAREYYLLGDKEITYKFKDKKFIEVNLRSNDYGQTVLKIGPNERAVVLLPNVTSPNEYRAFYYKYNRVTGLLQLYVPSTEVYSRPVLTYYATPPLPLTKYAVTRSPHDTKKATLSSNCLFSLPPILNIVGEEDCRCKQRAGRTGKRCYFQQTTSGSKLIAFFVKGHNDVQIRIYRDEKNYVMLHLGAGGNELTYFTAPGDKAINKIRTHQILKPTQYVGWVLISTKNKLELFAQGPLHNQTLLKYDVKNGPYTSILGKMDSNNQFIYDIFAGCNERKNIKYKTKISVEETCLVMNVFSKNLQWFYPISYITSKQKYSLDFGFKNGPRTTVILAQKDHDTEPLYSITFGLHDDKFSAVSKRGVKDPVVIIRTTHLPHTNLQRLTIKKIYSEYQVILPDRTIFRWYDDTFQANYLSFGDPTYNDPLYTGYLVCKEQYFYTVGLHPHEECPEEHTSLDWQGNTDFSIKQTAGNFEKRLYLKRDTESDYLTEILVTDSSQGKFSGYNLTISSRTSIAFQKNTVWNIKKRVVTRPELYVEVKTENLWKNGQYSGFTFVREMKGTKFSIRVDGYKTPIIVLNDENSRTIRQVKYKASKGMKIVDPEKCKVVGFYRHVNLYDSDCDELISLKNNRSKVFKFAQIRQQDVATFSFKGKSHCGIALRTTPSAESSGYDILLEHDRFSEIRKLHEEHPKHRIRNANLLSEIQHRLFSLHWSKGSIQLFVAGGKKPFLSWNDDHPLNVKYMFFTGRRKLCEHVNYNCHTTTYYKYVGLNEEYQDCTVVNVSDKLIVAKNIMSSAERNLLEFYLSVKGDRDAIVHLQKKRSGNVKYRVNLGETGNQFTNVKKSKEEQARHRIKTPFILSRENFRGFYFSYDLRENMLKIFVEGYSQPFLHWKDLNKNEFDMVLLRALPQTPVQMAYNCQPMSHLSKINIGREGCNFTSFRRKKFLPPISLETISTFTKETEVFYFGLKGEHSCGIILGTDRGFNDPYYWVIIGAQNNRLSEVRVNQSEDALIRKRTNQILSPIELHEFSMIYHKKEQKVTIQIEGYHWNEFHPLFQLKTQGMTFTHVTFTNTENKCGGVAIRCSEQNSQAYFSTSDTAKCVKVSTPNSMFSKIHSATPFIQNNIFELYFTVKSSSPLQIELGNSIEKEELSPSSKYSIVLGDTHHRVITVFNRSNDKPSMVVRQVRMLLSSEEQQSFVLSYFQEDGIMRLESEGGLEPLLVWQDTRPLVVSYFRFLRPKHSSKFTEISFNCTFPDISFVTLRDSSECKVWSGNHMEFDKRYNGPDVDGGVTFQLEFSVKGEEGCVVSLTAKKDFSNPYYLIYIGSGGNRLVKIVKKTSESTFIGNVVRTSSILSPDEFRGFVLRQNRVNGKISLRVDGHDTPLLSWRDENPLKIDHFSFGSEKKKALQIAFHCQESRDFETNFGGERPSMCQSMHTKNMTFDRFYPATNFTSDGLLHFNLNVKAENTFIIALMTYKGIEKSYYLIKLGAEGNQYIEIHRNSITSPVKKHKAPRLLGPDKNKQFKVFFEHETGKIKLTDADGEFVFIEWTDPEPIEVVYIGLTSFVET